jgi:superfamily II DNA or RNA helicase
MQFREYQSILIQEIWKALYEEFLNAIVPVLPTGGGKTVVFAEVCRQAVEKGIPVMVLCHRKELIAQAARKLRAVGLFPVLIDPSYRKEKISMCYVASVDTLRNRTLPDIGLLIIDEAHIRAFDPIALEYLSRGTKVAGFTATPERTGKKFLKPGRLADLYPKYSGQMGDYYQKIISPVSVRDLLELGYLVPPVYFGPEADLEGIKTKGGDYDENDVFERFNKTKIYSGVIENYQKYAAGKKAICFCVNVEHSIKTAETFRAAGIPAEHIDGESKDRDAILERFAKGTTMILCNYGITTTGYDEPTVEAIILFRATKIHSLYMQMLGRGSRLCEEINKTHFIVIDHGSHIARLGWWEEDYQYSLDLRFVSKTIGAGPIRFCEQCEAILPLSSAVCKYCNSIQEKQQEEMRLHEAKFVQFEKPDFIKIKPLGQMNIAELEEFREKKAYHLQWIVHQLLPRGEAALTEYATMKNYSMAWVKRQVYAAEEKRIANKRAIFEWMRANKHVTQDFLKEFASKKLKATHNNEEINILIPKILTAFGELKLGVLE